MKYLLFFSINFFGLIARSQDLKIDQAEIKLSIDSLIEKLNAIYVFPEVAEKMSEHVLHNYSTGKYEGISDPVVFSELITKDLQKISNDLHINMRFAPQLVEDMRNSDGNDIPDLDEMKAEMGKRNFGFEELKMLPGNIAYIKFDGFIDASLAGETASAVMNFAAYADAIIFDLRQNGGGSPSMIQLLSTYLFPETELIHLNNFYYRPGNETTQTWTLPYVPGKRNHKALVYVLTSNYTFSAAEEFTYNLKNLERATIVGETTGGGAHPGGRHAIGKSFICFIPNGRAINPITNTNWEGVGVSPDLAVSEEQALLQAQKMALDSLMHLSDIPEEKMKYQWNLEVLNAQLNPYTPALNEMTCQVGNFGPRKIFFENNTLYYQREGRPEFVLSPIGPNKYLIEEQEIMVEIEMKDKKPTAILITASDGMQDRSPISE